MFYTHQPADELLSKPLPDAPIEKTSKALNSLLSLPNQRFYNALDQNHHEAANNRRISINMMDRKEDAIDCPKSNTMEILMDHSNQRATWEEDPLRLCLVENKTSIALQSQEALSSKESLHFQSLMPFAQEEVLPYTSKPKVKFISKQPLSQLYNVSGPSQPINHNSPQVDNQQELNKEQLDLAFKLPFTTANAVIPPTPPAKESSATPACSPPTLLPVELYSNLDDYSNQYSSELPWLYTQETELSHEQLPSASLSGAFHHDSDGKHPQVITEPWEAIFHPLSTFKHNKGELEYYAWNPANLPIAAALVAQRVVNPTSHSTRKNVPATTPTSVAAEATIPHIMSTPSLLKPSPVLTMASSSVSDLVNDCSEATLVNNPQDSNGKEIEEGYYYDMLQKIRGSTASLSLDESRSMLRSVGGMKQKNRYTSNTSASASQKSFRRHVLAAACLLLRGLQKPTTRAASASPNTAIKTTTPSSPALCGYPLDDEKPIDITDPETSMMEKPRYWNEKKLFWAGFLCPLLWYYGSIHIRKTSGNSTESSCKNQSLGPNDLCWQKRCRLAALYFSIVLSVVILVASVKAAGSAATRQTQTGTIRAVIAN